MEMLLAGGIFLVSYIIIISEKVHRTVTSLVGALVMILLGVISQHQAIEGIDFNTLGLLIGMMVVVGIAKDSGIFQYIAIYAAKLAKGKPIYIFLLFGLIAAVFSALLDNVTTVLLLVPMIFVITNHLKVDPKPYLIGAILLSNIGGAATLIGDPPNIIIGGAAGLSFNDFLVHMAPLAAIITLVTLALLILIYRKQFTCKNTEEIMKLNPKAALVEVSLLKKSLFTILLVLIGFLTHSFTHLEGATIALSGAALLLLLTANDPHHHFAEVEWTTIFFFIGLFVLVTGLEQTGIIGLMAEEVVKITQGSLVATTLIILWGSAILSAIVNNIPFVTTMIPIIEKLGVLTGMPLTGLWWALAIGTDLGGNMTIVGASANVVVADMAAEQKQKISFLGYMKVAVPLTLVALVISTGYILVRYV